MEVSPSLLRTDDLCVLAAIAPPGDYSPKRGRRRRRARL